MHVALYLERVLALTVLAAWSVAVNLRERVAPRPDTAGPAPARRAVTQADRLRWN